MDITSLWEKEAASHSYKGRRASQSSTKTSELASIPNIRYSTRVWLFHPNSNDPRLAQAWYASPDSLEGTCYFKSMDGHRRLRPCRACLEHTMRTKLQVVTVYVVFLRGSWKTIFPFKGPSGGFHVSGQEGRRFFWFVVWGGNACPPEFQHTPGQLGRRGGGATHVSYKNQGPGVPGLL